MIRFPLLFILFAFSAVSGSILVRSVLQFDGGDEKITVLANFGNTAATVSLLHGGPAVDVGSVSVSSCQLFSVGQVTVSDIDGSTKKNYHIADIWQGRGFG